MILLMSIISSIFLCYFVYLFFGPDVWMIVISGVMLGCLFRLVYLVKDIHALIEGSSIGREFAKNLLLKEKKQVVQSEKPSIK